MTIVLCGGGSGGHITPLLAVASELRAKDKNIRLVYIGEKGGRFAHITQNSRVFDELHFISAGKLRRYHGESFITRLFDIKTNFLNLRDIFRLILGLLQSYRLLRKLKPNAILLKGGFVCVPVAFAAHKRNIPCITHDSDALPGLSNRIAARWSRFHAVALPAEYYRYPKKSIKVVGVPVDSRFREYSPAEQSILRAKYGIPKDARVILVTGGSNGARRLNQAIIDQLPAFIAAHPDSFVLHQIGAGNEDQIQSIAKNTSIKKQVTFFDFTDELFHMSAIADVVVTRAGASAMADLAEQYKACVVVPNPYLTGGHQLKNAQVYTEKNAARVVLESDLNQVMLVVDELLSDPKNRAELGANLHRLNPDIPAAQSLANLLLEVAQ